MSLVKSFSVGDGDMFYVQHGTNNFTTIDCYLSDDNKEEIVDELLEKSRDKYITRFISTHPDEDHIQGLEYLDSRMSIINFYCVKNDTIKVDVTDSFRKYRELRDSSKAFYISKGCSRKWMNQDGEDDNGKYIGSAGINILWPVIENYYYLEELEKVKLGESPNNISPIIRYSIENGASFIWMGDLEKEFMENIVDNVDLPKTNILFAPHHGRKSGRVPDKWMEAMDPDIVIMGEAPSRNLDYARYLSYNKITQNSAGDIVFECGEGRIDVFVSSILYSVDFLTYDQYKLNDYGCHYLGTLYI